MVRYLTRIVRDKNGEAVTGLELKLYPQGSYPSGGSVTAVEDSNVEGKYEFTIPDSLMSRYYDLYIVGGSYNPYEENIEVLWDWYFENINITNGMTLDLTTLTDKYGNKIPTDTIPINNHYETIITCHDTDRNVYKISESSSGREITFGLSSAGESDTAKIDLYVFIGGVNA